MNASTKNKDDKFKKGSCHKINILNAKNKDGSPIQLKVTQKKLVIIHPSLACPAIIKEGDPIIIYVLTDDDFHKTANEDNTKVDRAGWQSSINLRRSIAHRLKIQTFDNALTSKNGETVKDIPMFEDPTEALENIALRYIGKAGDKNNVKNHHHGERFEGIIRKDTLELYKKYNLSHLYQIIIYDHKKTAGLVKKKGSKGTLYDLSWISYDDAIQSDDKCNATKHKGPYVECQDKYTLTFLNEDAYIKHTDLKHAFNISKDGPLDFKKNKNLPIQNFHPIWIVPDKKPFNIGHLTDVHVSSRQHAFKKSKAQFIHGQSAEIGPMVNTTFDTLKDLMNQFGADEKIDLLIFTGDLIDYGRNYHPKKFIEGTKKTTGDIWQEMMLSNLNTKDKKANTDDYPRSIDNVIMFSLFVYYYKEFGKPIFLTSGNHECYSLPFGISSRIKLWRTIGGLLKDINPLKKKRVTHEQLAEEAKTNLKKDIAEAKKKGGGDIAFMRTNEGVPADHNLTIPESILMYGPDYSGVAMGGGVDKSGRQNFYSKNLDWFYAVFTPMSDYSFDWGKQCFIGLQWGDAERMFGFLGAAQKGLGGGFLPRANKSITKAQKKLVNDAVAVNKPCNILLIHFTLTNYEQPVKISEKGIVNIDDNNTHGIYDFGTFEKNRYFLYNLIAKNKINYTLSGHSHRSALYQVTDFNAKATFMTHHDDSSDPEPPTIKTKGIAAKGNVYKNYNSNACKMIVSSCGGPIGIQNYDNELATWGLDNPSGSFIIFDAKGKDKEIGIKIPKVTKAAIPRLAVALDYADILGPELKHGAVFDKFESVINDGPFTLEVNPRMKLPKIDWIKSIELHVFRGKSADTVSAKLKPIESNKYNVTFSDDDLFEDAQDEDTLIFMSLITKENLPGSFAHYDQKSPWTFQVEINSRKEFRKIGPMRIKTGVKVSGYAIKRHSTNGEIPDFEWYSSKFKEYQS